jgi:quaternary ammonium compound-resistance protein SugE
MAWIYLVTAGLLEIGFTTSMRYTEGFTRLLPTILFAAFIAASLYFLSKATEVIPLGTAYAVWGGIGAVGTVLVGIFYFQEPADLPRLILLTLLISCIVGLKLVSPH